MKHPDTLEEHNNSEICFAVHGMHVSTKLWVTIGFARSIQSLPLNHIRSAHKIFILLRGLHGPLSWNCPPQVEFRLV